MVVAVAVLFTFCLAPPCATEVYSLAVKNLPVFKYVTYILLTLNSSVNLFLYLACSTNFRMAFWEWSFGRWV